MKSVECILFEIFSARDFGKRGISGQIGVIGPFFFFFLAHNNFLSPSLPKDEEKKLLNEVLVTCFFHNSPTLSNIPRFGILRDLPSREDNLFSYLHFLIFFINLFRLFLLHMESGI